MFELVRFGVSMEKELLEKYDQLITETYDNRSEAIRDLIRKKIISQNLRQQNKEVVGSLTLLYNHYQRGLTARMLEIQHEAHSLFESNLHLHLSHDLCLEVIIVRGLARRVQKVANLLIGLKGVKHGELIITSAEVV